MTVGITDVKIVNIDRLGDGRKTGSKRSSCYTRGGVSDDGTSSSSVAVRCELAADHGKNNRPSIR